MKSTPVWVDRKGREEALGLEPEDLKLYHTGRVSPDGRQVLLATLYPPMDVWLFDLERQTLRRQTFEGNQVHALWGPGPERFTINSDRDGSHAVYSKIVNTGQGEVERLSRDDLGIVFLNSRWSPDGRRLAFVGGKRSPDILMLTGEGKVEPFLETSFRERWPEFSPNGRWIVYGSDESGRMEIYVRPYPGPGSSVQISTQGGESPAWSRDGGEIFYRAKNKFYAVSTDQEEEALRPDMPVELFEGSYGLASPARSYDVAPDGRFLVLKHPDEAAKTEEFFPTRIRFIQNWFQELERLAPTVE